MRPDSQVKNMNAATSSAIEEMISQADTPNGILTNITIGDVNGISELQNTRGDSGLFMAVKPMYNPTTKMMESGVRNCWESVSLSTAAPIAANSEA